MPYVDASENLVDPELAAQCFTVVRRQQIMQQNGRPTITEKRYDAKGAVFPTGDQSLVREEAYENQAKTIQVVTRFRLRGPAKDSNGKDWQPDLIFWHGDYFIVRSLDDYTPFGVGMTSAECASYNYVNQPPQEQQDL